jgi:Protein kinase domain
MTTTPLPFPHQPATPVGTAAPLPGGTQVAHLTIDRVLHEGQHTIVYLSHDSARGEPVALMEYFPRALALRQPDGSLRARQAGDAIALSVAREAFVQDANTLQSVHHPGLVPVLGSLQANRTVYRAMPYLEGLTLERQVLGREGPATVGEATRLLDAMLDALEALHRAGVVHGAVRPDQILIGKDGRPLLLGLASAGAEIVGHEPGPWSAPEQAAMSRHDRINSATDLYMLALCVWFFATGEEPPWLRERLAKPHVWDPAAALAQLPEGEGDSATTLDNLAVAVVAALALQPSERPQRVADLRALLHPLAAHSSFEPSGDAPLWVGVVPDRESQWEVLDAGPPTPPPVPSSGRPALRAAAVIEAPPPRAAEPVSEPVVTPAAAPVAARGSGAAPRRRWMLPLVLTLGAAALAAVWWSQRAPPPPPLGLPDLPQASVPAAPAVPAVERPSLPSVPATAATPTAPVAPPEAPAPAAVPAAPLPAAAPASVVLAAPVPAARAAPPSRTPPPVRTAAPPPRAAAPVRTSPRALCANRSQFALLYCLQQQCAKPGWRNHSHCNELRRRGDIR